MKRSRKKGARRATRKPDAAAGAPPLRVELNLKTWQSATLLLALAAVICGWLAWHCLRDPQINFLPHASESEWILFPRAMEGSAQRIANLDTIFRREFVLDSQPANARLEIRAAKRAEIKINGATIAINSADNWKDIARTDVTAQLRPGRNLMEARVFNDNGPPALWLNLAADSVTLRSDTTWEASCTGSAWRPAALARTPRLPGAGNPLGDGETVGAALPSVWMHWLIFAALAAAAAVLGSRLLRGSHGEATFSRSHMMLLLAATAAAWLLLYANNARLMPFLQGFDSQDHLNYIQYVQERHALPWPTEGFEMFQPPLYYVVSAFALSLFGLTTEAPAAIFVLRLLTFIFGAAQFVLVLLSVRLLFPERRPMQWVAFGFAAFLPMQLYLSHYVTNETLAATLVTASLYLGLRVLRAHNPSVAQLAGLGLCLGAAMLTKATALLVVAPLFLALVLQLLAQRAPFANWLQKLGVVLAVFVVACGWHYFRIWRRFGTPLVGNWDPAAGFPWWQDPGLHSGADYFRFGEALIAPLFSGFWSFADGIYSTLWGDALCGGVPHLTFRPPWNYDLMVAGYLPAIVPTLLILVGAAVACWRFVRRPSVEWFLLFGLCGAVAFGLVFMTLKVPSYAQVKAFYGLAALVPICCFGAIGWEVLTRGSAIRQGLLGALLLFFAINSFASFWIVKSVPQQVYYGARLGLQNKPGAAIAAGQQAVAMDPSDSKAQRFLASVLNDSGRVGEALSIAQRAVELSPRGGASHLQLGMVLARQGELERAIAEARRALELGPENPAAYDFLLRCLSTQQRGQEVIEVARAGLAMFPFHFELHHSLGLALAQKGDFAAAADHFVYALQLRPDLPQERANLRLALRHVGQPTEAAQLLPEIARRAIDVPVVLNEIAWFYATQPDANLRNGQEAVRLAERAADLTDHAIADVLATLAAAYAEAGRMADATKTAGEARDRARAAGDTATVRLAEKLLAVFQTNRAFHDEPAPP